RSSVWLRKRALVRPEWFEDSRGNLMEGSPIPESARQGCWSIPVAERTDRTVWLDVRSSAHVASNAVGPSFRGGWVSRARRALECPIRAATMRYRIVLYRKGKSCQAIHHL